MKLDRILVGVDFSPESDIAVLHAAELARSRSARLILAHVVSLPSDLLADSSYDPLFRAQGGAAELGVEHRNQSDDLLQATAGRCQTLGIDTEAVLVDDNPSDGLARIADEVGADLLVVGTHGRTGLKRFLLGSVAERAARLARVHTLIARGPIEEGGSYHRVMVASDFSAASDAAMAAALSIAPPDGRIEVVHCWQTPALPTGALMERMRDDIRQAVQKRGEQWIASHGRGRVTFVPVEASAADGVLRRTEERGCDLIVTGSHGRRGARRWLLGSVTETIVRHAPCSVLIVHPPGGADGAA
jgi:nucleotide-binding universal stress UspA family protein